MSLLEAMQSKLPIKNRQREKLFMTYESSIKSRYVNWRTADRIIQGDILSGLRFSVGFEAGTQLILNEHNFKYAIVLSQDCDLESHFRALNIGKENDRAMLNGILICPAYPFEQFYSGTHLEGQDLGTLPTKKDYLKENDKIKRYHFLEGDSETGVTDLIIDFKDFFTVPCDVVLDARRSNYIATVNELYRESLSQRFAAYLSRIGLPELTRS